MYIHTYTDICTLTHMGKHACFCQPCHCWWDPGVEDQPIWETVNGFVVGKKRGSLCFNILFIETTYPRLWNIYLRTPILIFHRNGSIPLPSPSTRVTYAVLAHSRILTFSPQPGRCSMPSMAHQLILIRDKNPAPPLANMLIGVATSTYLNNG